MWKNITKEEISVDDTLTKTKFVQFEQSKDNSSAQGFLLSFIRILK